MVIFLVVGVLLVLVLSSSGSAESGTGLPGETPSAFVPPGKVQEDKRVSSEVVQSTPFVSSDTGIPPPPPNYAEREAARIAAENAAAIAEQQRTVDVTPAYVPPSEVTRTNKVLTPISRSTAIAGQTSGARDANDVRRPIVRRQ